MRTIPKYLIRDTLHLHNQIKIVGWEPLGSQEVNSSLSMDYSVTTIKNNSQDIDSFHVKVIK